MVIKKARLYGELIVIVKYLLNFKTWKYLSTKKFMNRPILL